jgi:mono/diheme cytochrome c family protein
MPEYIERDKATKILQEEAANHYPTAFHIGLFAAARAIDAIPAADVRPVGKAEWLPFGKRGIYGMMYACSSCHAKYDGKTNFCPNCGAMMEES